MRYTVYIKVNGCGEKHFNTVAESEPEAFVNAHHQYAVSLNMSIAAYRTQIKIAGYKERLCATSE